ncbi:hypothetical protein HMPREF3180_02403 [Leptotrichia wadei]|jgi:hypothetical protein|uniref:Uncharacterized protein n=2 Tax=Leptotrichia wadei TaxID=157687 RepID=A0A133ZUK4_9FUSO|nr:hypothetical protein HMPREF3180_02403 [Leptotrichia wadei]
MKKIIVLLLIILVIFLYFNNSREVKKEGFYSVSFFYSDNKEKIFQVENIEIDYFKNIIIKLKKIYNKMELKKIIVYYKDKKIGEIIVNERLGIDSLKDAKFINVNKKEFIYSIDKEITDVLGSKNEKYKITISIYMEKERKIL